MLCYEMDTGNDYLYALQLQNDVFDLTENGNNFNNTLNYTDETESVKFISTASSIGAVVDLTGEVYGNNKHKRNAVGDSSQPVKQSRAKHVEVTDSVVDHSWETLDPNPDIHGLFLAFNRQYFWSSLHTVTVKWSNRMTVCAGLCRYEGGLCSISLSEPLLKLRPRKDLVETLLHEMIHAYLFLTNNREHRDRDGHGTEFCKHMYRINISAGTKISIYHSFHDEVRLYRQHWWKCNGPCQKNKPFYGYVKRSINRAPGPCDNWWTNHQAICGGMFIKIKEPEGYGSKKKKKKTDILSVPKKTVKPANKITNFIKILDSPTENYPVDSKIMSNENDALETGQLDTNLESLDETTKCPVCNVSVFSDCLNGHLQNCSELKKMFGDETDDKCECPACNAMVDRSSMNEHLDNCKMLSNVFENDDTVSIFEDANYINCPNCNKMVKDNNINDHLDICLMGETKEELLQISPEIPKQNSNENQIKCPCCPNCNKMVNDSDINEHLDNCLLGETEGGVLQKPPEISMQNIMKNQVECPCCKMVFENIIKLDDHVDKCLF